MRMPLLAANRGSSCVRMLTVLERPFMSPTWGLIITVHGTRCSARAARLRSSVGPASMSRTGSMIGWTDPEALIAGASSLMASSSNCLPRRYGKYIVVTPLIEPINDVLVLALRRIHS